MRAPKASDALQEERAHPMSLELLSLVGQINLMAAAVAYCGSKTCPDAHAFFQTLANVVVFAAILALSLLLLTWIDSNTSTLKSLARKATRPIREITADILYGL
jgi:hypothetical protein